MVQTKEKGAETKTSAFKGSIAARNQLAVIAPEKEEKEVQGVAGVHMAELKAEEPKAKPKAALVKAKPKAAPVAPPEKRRIKKVKFSVAIDPGDMDLLRKASGKLGKSVSLFVAELVGELVRK